MGCPKVVVQIADRSMEPSNIESWHPQYVPNMSAICPYNTIRTYLLSRQVMNGYAFLRLNSCLSVLSRCGDAPNLEGATLLKSLSYLGTYYLGTFGFHG